MKGWCDVKGRATGLSVVRGRSGVRPVVLSSGKQRRQVLTDLIVIDVCVAQIAARLRVNLCVCVCVCVCWGRGVEGDTQDEG